MEKSKKSNKKEKDWGVAKKIGLILLFLVVLCTISYGIVVFVRGLNEKIVESQLNDESWLTENVSVAKDSSLGKIFMQLVSQMKLKYLI